MRQRLMPSPVQADENRGHAENARRQDLLDLAAEWVWEWDRDFRVSRLSPGFAESTGLPPQFFLGRRLEESLGITVADAQWTAHRALIESRQRFRDFVFKVPGGNGEAVWLKISGMPLFDPAGGFYGYQGIGNNVTKEVEANLALRAREQRYALFFDVSPVWFWENDASHRLTFISPNAQRTLGMMPADYLGRRLSDTPGVVISPEMGRLAITAQSARKPYDDFIHRLNRADGSTVWISTSGTPTFDEHGRYRGHCGISRDVTAQVEAENALRERDRRFRELVDTTSVSFWETDVNGALVYVSPKFEARYGIPVADLLGQSLFCGSRARIEPEVRQKIAAAMGLQQPLRDILSSYKLWDGKIVWFRTDAIAIFDPDGAYCGYWGVSKDVTVEIEADRMLRESERQFREVLEASADFYWEQDAQYRVTYASPNFEDLTGIPLCDIIGCRLTDHPELSFEPERGKVQLLAQKAKKPFRDFVFARKVPNESTRWFKTSGAPIFDRNGVFTGYRGVGAVITAQVEAEAAARLAQRRLHEAVAHVTQPIVVYDAEDRVVTYNQAFTDLHQAPNTNTPVGQGVSFRELAEWQLRVGFYADAAAGAGVDIEALLACHQTEVEHTYHLSDGRWMLVAYRRLPGGGRVGLWADVTALKRGESERRALERQVQHSQRLESLGTLAGGVAHEINNALVPVIALTKMVAEKVPEGSRERRNLALVLRGAERSRDLVKQILAFSRKEAEDRPLESVDLGAVLAEVLQLMRATLPERIIVQTEIEPVPAVLGDPCQLHQAIINLMTNAAQAIGAASGRIMVGLRPDPDGIHLHLSVSDSGCGMNEGTLARIFDPFFTTKPVGEGTGLGLSVVHGIIRDHGGRIDVTSSVGQGACFDLVLPGGDGGSAAGSQIV
jgi:PAS domain S-box-containing protein